MPISIVCPTCSAKLNVSDDSAGKVVPCPLCQTPLRELKRIARESRPKQPPPVSPSPPSPSQPASYPGSQPLSYQGGYYQINRVLIQNGATDNNDADKTKNNSTSSKYSAPSRWSRRRRRSQVSSEVIIGGMVLLHLVLVVAIIASVIHSRKTAVNETHARTTSHPPSEARNPFRPSEAPHTPVPPDATLPPNSLSVGEWVRFDSPDGSLTMHFPDGQPETKERETVSLQGVGGSQFPFLERSRHSQPLDFPATPQAEEKPKWKFTRWERDYKSRTLTVMHLHLPNELKSQAGNIINSCYNNNDGITIEDRQITIGNNRTIQIVTKMREHALFTNCAVEYGNNQGRVVLFCGKREVIGANDSLIYDFLSRLTINER